MYYYIYLYIIYLVMKIANGDLEIKDSLHFGRPNFIKINRDTKCYEFYIDSKLIDFKICSTSTDDTTGDLSIDSLIVGTTATIGDLLTANELYISNGATFGGDVVIDGSLAVLGGISTINSNNIGVTGPLLKLAEGNTLDTFDIGFYGLYNDGITRFAGLFRDTSDTNKKFKLFDGITSDPNPNFNNEEINNNLADLELKTLCSDLILSNDIGTTSIGVTGSGFINTLSSNQIGTTSIGVTGSGFINDLNSNIITSNEIGVTNLGVTGNAIVDGGITINTFLDVNGDTSLLNVEASNIVLTGDLNAGDEINGNSLSITTIGYFGSDVDIGGDLCVTGDLKVDNNTLLVDSVNNNVGIGVTSPDPSYQLDVSGIINSKTGLYIDGIDIETVFNIIQIENRKTYFNTFLTLNNSNEVTGNYVGVTEFSYTNNSSVDTLFISNIIVSIQDDSPFNLNDYGGIGSSLINGINLYYTTNSGSTKNYIIGTTFNIKKNSDYNNYTNDINILDLGTGDTVFTANINFRNNGSFIILPQNEKFSIEVNDNFTLINSQKVQITGFLYPNSFL